MESGAAGLPAGLLFRIFGFELGHLNYPNVSIVWMKVKLKNLYSKVVRLIFAPIVEPMLEYLEQGVTINDHKHSFNRLIQEIEKFIKMNRDNDVSRDMSTFIVKVEKLVSICTNGGKPDIGEETKRLFEQEIHLILGEELDIYFQEKDLRLVILQLLALHCGFDDSSAVSSIKHNERLIKNIGIVLERASWCGSTEEIAAAQTVSRACFFCLSNGIVEAHDVANIMSQLITTLPANRWFYSGRVIYGTSFLLRALLLICNTDYRDQFIDYVNDVRERLLRKLEIKQEKIFNFDGHVPKDASLILEQMRFILAILEISKNFKDLRFLNAALKANDRVCRFFRRLSISNNATGKNVQKILTALHYITGIKMQEDLYNEALCQN